MFLEILWQDVGYGARMPWQKPTHVDPMVAARHE